VLGTYKFARFTSDVEGAKGFLRALVKGRVAGILADPNATARDLAAAMYENHYYTGTTGTADDRINAYAGLITNGAAKVRKAAGAAPGGNVPPTPFTPPSPPSTPPAPPASSSFFATLATLTLMGTATWWLLRKKV
jgi:hypothetical protein